jgi:ubiquinone/menaquinone biosynthesis C-methylase UbiE
LDGNGKLLDLGCGTGELAIPMASYFKKVLAVDTYDQVLELGAKMAQSLDINNIRWQKRSSNALNEPKGPFRLATMGQYFHWMDSKTTLKSLYNLVQVGGGVVIVGSIPTKKSYFAKNINRAIHEIVNKYLGPHRRASSHIYRPTSEKWESKVFPNSNFKYCTKYNYEKKLPVA